MVADMSEPRTSQKVLYYTLGVALPAEARDWVERDINTRAFVIRRAAVMIVAILVGFLIGVWLFEAHPSILIGAFIGASLVGFLQMTVLADYVRRRSLRYYERKWNRHPAR